MSVSKLKVSNRFLWLLVIGATMWIGIAYYTLTSMDIQSSPVDRFQKTSVDDTSNFNLTEPHTQCQYVYDSVNKTIVQAKGSEHCELPSLN